MVRIGIAGFGIMGRGHGRDILEGRVPGSELTAICDTDPKVLEAVKKEYPQLATFNNAPDMFRSGTIDAVMVATPHYDHPVIAMQDFEHKIHAIIENPAGVSTKNVREMNEKAAKAGVVFGIMYQMRNTVKFRKMREIVRSGELGELKRVSIIITDWYRPQAYYNAGGWRATWKGEGGGVLINQCPHNLDIWQWICGMPKRITAFTHHGKWHDIEVEDDVTAYFEYENGATGIFVACTADCPGTNRYEIMGDKGKLVLENDELVHYKLDVNEREFNKTNTVMFGSPKAQREVIAGPEDYPAHANVMTDFVNKINGKGELTARGEEGINGLTISNAMHLSGWLGKTVELPLDEDLFLSELEKRF